jgi:hypothetical protein
LTTIAWDGKTLAGDTRCTQNGLPCRMATKVHRIVMPDGEIGLFAGSGARWQCDEVVNWIAAGVPPARRPKFETDSFNGIVIRESGVFTMDSGCQPFEVLEEFTASGSGRDFAIAAMHCGKTALEAVEIAALYDIYSGGPFTAVTLDGG